MNVKIETRFYIEARYSSEATIESIIVLLVMDELTKRVQDDIP